jgi:phage recombination protein Bet
MSTALATQQRPSLAFEFGGKYGVEAAKVFTILKETVLKSKDPVTDAEVAAFIIVCNQYDLNPFIKEIYGFMSKGKMQYVLGVDGWVTLCNRQPNMNGVDFKENFVIEGESGKKTLDSVTCTIHRKDRSLPTVVTEYFNECRRDTDNWKQQPIRMTRHKSLIQCARIAFGFAGIIDEDEAERMDGFNGQTIEAQIEGDPEIDALMQKLEYNSTTRRMSYQSFPDRAKQLDYLQAQVAKMGGTTTSASSTTKAKAPAKEKAGKPELVKDDMKDGAGPPCPHGTPYQTHCPQCAAEDDARIASADKGQYFTAEDIKAEAQPQPQQQEAKPAAAKPKMNW